MIGWFRLAVEMDNDAFGDDPRGELVRVLRGLADDFEEEGIARNGTILDINGNTVGSYEVRS